MSRPPEPLPRIKAAEFMRLVFEATGDQGLADRVGEALEEHAKERAGEARSQLIEFEGTPGWPFDGPGLPGSPGNPLPESAARELFAELAALDYVPFDYPKDGCFARAHEMCRIMEQRNIACAKVWNYKVTEPLVARNDEFGDALGRIIWRYHVAPVVWVTGSNGVKQQMVFDPSLDRDRPLPLEEWQEKQGGPQGKRLEFTDTRPYAYWPKDVADPNERFGKMIQDPTHEATRTALDMFSVRRDLARAGL